MADAPCKGNRGRHGCQEIVTEGGVDDSGFCENCWYPTVVQDHAKYHELIAEGYSRTQAALLSGLADPDEFEENKGPHKLGTAPITAVTQERDDDCDEEMQEELTSSILDRLNEDDQSQKQ